MQPPRPTTPDSVTKQIIEFCRDDVGVDSNPVYVEIHADGYVQNDCHGNVERCIENNGGEEQQGWIIWETVGLLLQAEYHAVWLSPNGQLIDVTPKLGSETRILFLPDPRNHWTGKELVASIHRLLSDDPETRRAVAGAEKDFHRRNAAFKRGEAPGPTAEQMNHAMRHTLRGIEPPVGRNSPCPCGSGRKYKKCCMD